MSQGVESLPGIVHKLFELRERDGIRVEVLRMEATRFNALRAQIDELNRLDSKHALGEELAADQLTIQAAGTSTLIKKDKRRCASCRQEVDE